MKSKELFCTSPAPIQKSLIGLLSTQSTPSVASFFDIRLQIAVLSLKRLPLEKRGYWGGKESYRTKAASPCSYLPGCAQPTSAEIQALHDRTKPAAAVPRHSEAAFAPLRRTSCSAPSKKNQIACTLTELCRALVFCNSQYAQYHIDQSLPS